MKPDLDNLQPIDRIAMILIVLLSLIMGLLVWHGDRAVPYIRDFSWQNQLIGAEDNFFTLTFSRPMDRTSVEANLQTEPPLNGKFSWVGRRAIYTLNAPAQYATSYQVKLRQAQDNFTNQGQTRKLIQPFVGNFRTRDRSLAYIGVTGAEKGRLILYNLTKKQKTILTPPDLVVEDFKPYPDGKRILFSATEWASYKPGLFEAQLQAVTTEADLSAGKPAGEISLVLDNHNYQNLKFDLSADGQVIVIQRADRDNLGNFSLWVLRPDSPPQPLDNKPGGEFAIAPDSESVAIALEEGVTLLPLTPAGKPLDFFPKFSRILSFSRDGTAAAMVKFNSDYTRSLFFINNQGVQKELLKASEIVSCQFDPRSPIIYCLASQPIKGKEQIFLTAIDIATTKVTPLLPLPDRRDTQMSLSPDGSALLIDNVVATGKLPEEGELTTPEGAAIATSNILLLSLPTTLNSPLQPEQLPLIGFQPRWLP